MGTIGTRNVRKLLTVIESLSTMLGAAVSAKLVGLRRRKENDELRD
jgi:hypothetical protein